MFLPFASSLMFQYVANFIYDGDAPLAERRAQALTIDQSKLRELMGEAALRSLWTSILFKRWSIFCNEKHTSIWR